MAEETKRPDEENISNLQNLTNTSVFIEHHRQVVQAYKEIKCEIITANHMAAGEQFTPEQIEKLTSENKMPIILDYISPSMRTISGMLAGNKYDITFNPREERDQKISDLLKNWYTYNAYQGKFQKVDNEAAMNAWAGGYGYVETVIEFIDGERPIIKSYGLSPLTVYFDPDSSDAGTREDANFVDRVLWLSKKDLENKFPLLDFSTLTYTVSNYTKTAKHVDNDHEFMNSRNNTYKIVERFYKVIENVYYQLDDDLNRVELDKETAMQMQQDGKEIAIKPVQYLFNCIACPAWGEKFLHNGKYFCQPRRQRDKAIMFPIQEIPCTVLNGKVWGYVKTMIHPQLLINVAITQLYDHLKQETGNNVITKASNWADGEADRYAKERTMSGKTFFAAEDVQNLGNVVVNAPKNAPMSSNNANLLQFALSALKELSSTPPALQGQQESSSTSGVLNEQRIQQGSVQNQGFTTNIMNFKRDKAELMLAYLFEYPDQFSNESFRLVQDENGTAIEGGNDENMVMRQTVGGENHAGEWDDTIKMLNDPLVYEYDVVIEPSAYSATQKANNITALVEVMRMGLLNQNPDMASKMVVALFDMLNIPADIKNSIMETAAQQQQQLNQQNQLEQQGQALQNQSQAVDNAQSAGNLVPPEVLPSGYDPKLNPGQANQK